MRAIFLILLFTAANCMAQKESHYWCWGPGRGLDFNIIDPATGLPTPATSGIPARHEGGASLCNNLGELKLYTDGMTVYNCCHLVVQDGTGLAGHQSSTESAIIVPDLNDNGKCYIFTSDAMEAGGCDCLSYSIVDLNLNNGLGAVTVKNVLLWTPVLEKLTAVKHSNGHDVWIVAHEWDSNRFLAFLLTDAGLNTVPVISSAGMVHTGFGYNSPGRNHAVGYMKASPNGKKLACAVTNQGGFQLFDFDNATGMVSNPLTFTNNNATRSIFDDSYGIEFSPDNSKLYVRTLGGTSGGGIVQINLAAGSNAAIVSSATNLSPTNTVMSGIQLGPDGRIYVAGTVQFLGVINFPNLLGVNCGYTPAAINVPNTAVGLPQAIVAPFTFSQTCNCGAVPIDLLEFTCVTESNYVVLSWEAFSEKNIAYYEIERSGDGSSFESIGRVDADETGKYMYTDVQCSSQCYYRIKQVGEDGSYSYSAIRKVDLPVMNMNRLKVFPHPVKAGQSISLRMNTADKGTVRLKIVDLLGRELYSSEESYTQGENSLNLDVPRLKQGVYFIHAVTKDYSLTEKIMIE